MIGQPPPAPEQVLPAEPHSATENAVKAQVPREIGGREGLEPTRYGDWEKNGRCIDF